MLDRIEHDEERVKYGYEYVEHYMTKHARICRQWNENYQEIVTVQELAHSHHKRMLSVIDTHLTKTVSKLAAASCTLSIVISINNICSSLTSLQILKLPSTTAFSQKCNV